MDVERPITSSDLIQMLDVDSSLVLQKTATLNFNIV